MVSERVSASCCRHFQGSIYSTEASVTRFYMLIAYLDDRENDFKAGCGDRK